VPNGRMTVSEEFGRTQKEACISKLACNSKISVKKIRKTMKNDQVGKASIQTKNNKTGNVCIT
jgi:hypothetical protein